MAKFGSVETADRKIRELTADIERLPGAARFPAPEYPSSVRVLKKKEMKSISAEEYQQIQNNNLVELNCHIDKLRQVLKNRTGWNVLITRAEESAASRGVHMPDGAFEAWDPQDIKDFIVSTPHTEATTEADNDEGAVEVPEAESVEVVAEDTEVMEPAPSVAPAYDGLFDQIGSWWRTKGNEFKTRFWVGVTLVVLAFLAMMGGGGLRAFVLIAAIAAAIYFAPRIIDWFKGSSVDAQTRLNSIDNSWWTALLFGVVAIFVAFLFAPLYADWRWSGEDPGWYAWLLGIVFVVAAFMVGGLLSKRDETSEEVITADNQATEDSLADRVRVAQAE